MLGIAYFLCNAALPIEPSPALPYAPDRILIKLSAEATGPERTALQSEIGATHVHTFGSGAEVWMLPPSVNVESAINLVKVSPLVEYVEPDWKIMPSTTVPGDEDFPLQWSMYNTGQVVAGQAGTQGADIDAIHPWDISVGLTDPNSRPIIAVIDTGIDYDHPDLSSNMWINAVEADGETNEDDDDNGYTDDIYGYDFRDVDADPTSNAQASPGHGTHVAGIIGAEGQYEANSEGIAGVNWKSRIMALKIFKSGGSPIDSHARVSDAVDAIDYARANGADVINASWTIDPNCIAPCSRTIEAAIKDAGRAEIIFVAAAGNSGINVDGNPSNRVYPVCYTLDNIIGVTSTNNQDVLSNNYGATSVDLGAPGTQIYSTLPRQDCYWNNCGDPPCDPPYICEDQDKYGYRTGSSMAAPHVAGVAALLRAIRPGIPALSVKARILANVDPNITTGQTVTGGRLNAYPE